MHIRTIAAALALSAFTASAQYLGPGLPITNITYHAGQATLSWDDYTGIVGFKLYTTLALEPDQVNWLPMDDAATGLTRMNPSDPGDHVFALSNTTVTVSGAADKRFYRLVAVKGDGTCTCGPGCTCGGNGGGLIVPPGSITVTFDLNDGPDDATLPVYATVYTSATAQYGYLPTPTPPDGFAGWARDPEGDDMVTSSTVVGNSSHTLYAQWEDERGGVPCKHVHSNKLGDTSDWIAIACKRLNGKKHYLIVRLNAIEVNKTFTISTSGFPIPSYDYLGCSAETAIKNWYNANALTGLKGRMVRSNVNTKSAMGSFGGILPGAGGYSEPRLKTSSSDYEYPFILSYTESSAFLCLSSLSLLDISVFGKINWARMVIKGDGLQHASWLRTPTPTSPVGWGALSELGTVHDRPVLTPAAVRPAAWVEASSLFR